MPDTLAPHNVLPLLRGRFGHPYIYHERCDSTQRLLGAEEPEGAVAVCESQTAGRGRLGRSWDAPSGAAILCSVVLRPPRFRPAPELSLVAGLAVAEAVEEALAGDGLIKWPNDVLVGGRKVAGLLAEATGSGIVLGIGINVNQSDAELPDSGRTPAGSLRSADGIERERAPLLAGLLDRLERRYDTWIDAGLPALLPAIAARDALRGHQVAIMDATGTALGIDSDGCLLIETEHGIRRIASGEVRPR